MGAGALSARTDRSAPPPAAGVAGFLLALAAALAFTATAYRFPYHDAHAHLARYALLARLVGGEAVPCFEWSLLPTPYIGLDLVGAALVRATTPDTAATAVAMLCVLAFSVGFAALVTATDRARWAYAPLGPMLALGWPLFKGFEAFVLGFGLWMAWAGWWLRTREHRSAGQAAGLAVAGAALFLVHMSGAVFALLLAGCDVVTAFLGRRDGPEARSRLTRAATGLTVLTLAVGVLGAAYVLTTPAVTGGENTDARFLEKLAFLPSPLLVFSWWQAGIALAALAAVWAHNAWATRVTVTRFTRDALVLTAFVGMLAFLVMPLTRDGVSHVGERFLMLTFLLPCAAFGAHVVERGARSMALATTALSLAYVALLVPPARRVESHFRQADALAAMIPPGARVLPIRPGTPRVGRTRPMSHYDQWLTVDRGARVPGTMTWPVGRHLAHVRQTCGTPAPPWMRGDGTPELDWARIGREYDYIVEFGATASERERLGARADEVATRGDMVLYRVRRAD